jgi:hypothetical protein
LTAPFGLQWTHGRRLVTLLVRQTHQHSKNDQLSLDTTRTATPLLFIQLGLLCPHRNCPLDGVQRQAGRIRNWGHLWRPLRPRQRTLRSLCDRCHHCISAGDRTHVQYPLGRSWFCSCWMRRRALGCSSLNDHTTNNSRNWFSHSTAGRPPRVNLVSD